MKTIILAAALLSLTAGAAFAADSVQAVMDRHVTAMKAGNLDAVMADYADNALVIAPHGIAPGQKEVSGNDVFVGKANIRKFFAVLNDKDHVPGSKSMTVKYESRGNDTAIMRWVQFPGTKQEVAGNDTWVVRDGKVITQIVAVDPAKK